MVEVAVGEEAPAEDVGGFGLGTLAELRAPQPLGAFNPESLRYYCRQELVSCP